MVLELNDNQFLAALTKLCERLRVTKQSQDIFQATYSNQLHSSYPFLPCPFKATRRQTLGWFLAAEEFLPMPGCKPDQILSTGFQSSHQELRVGRMGCLSYLLYSSPGCLMRQGTFGDILFPGKYQFRCKAKPALLVCLLRFASLEGKARWAQGCLVRGFLEVWEGSGNDKVLNTFWIPRKQGTAARSSSFPSGLVTTAMSWVYYCLWENPWCSVLGSKENTEDIEKNL